MNKTDKQTILIVDDTAINVRMLNEILRDDYRVLFATNGQDALNTAAETKPDIVLLDVMMPEMDGYEVCRRLKNDLDLKDVPVIFITALAEATEEVRGLKLGAVDYITKPFNPDIVKLRVGNHLELKRQRDILARLSHIDGLTGIANRREFDEYLEREWLRAQRMNKPLSVFMIDVDFFKRYNDRYGHITGDDCLKKIAATLERSLTRPSDLVARYGGEEFSCVLPDTDKEGMLHTAGNILETIRSLKIPHADSGVFEFVTVSIGAASTIPENGSKPADIVKAADCALYGAKAAGRNRVKVYNGNFPQNLPD